MAISNSYVDVKHDLPHIQVTQVTQVWCPRARAASLSEGVGVVRWLEAIRKRPPFWAILCARWSSLGKQQCPLDHVENSSSGPTCHAVSSPNSTNLHQYPWLIAVSTYPQLFIHIHTRFVKYDVNWLLKISTSTTIQNFRLGVYWPQQKISMINRLVKLSSSESLSIFSWEYGYPLVN